MVCFICLSELLRHLRLAMIDRHVSLVHKKTADYKLAARIIASRLGPHLNRVVDTTQTGFLTRKITSSVLLGLLTRDK